MKLGYVRVSAKDQQVERQVLKMRELGIEERFIFIDHGWSGKNFDRPEYQAMKRILRQDDVVYLDALDRLGRDYDGIIREWKEITRDLGADIVVLENETLFDSRKFREMGDIGKLMEDQFLALLAYVAEQERKNTKRRQMEGIAIARAKGVHFGRPGCTIPPDFMEICQQWREGRITAVQAMKLAGIKKTSFYKAVKELCQG